MTTLLQAEGLARRYGKHWALRKLDLTVSEGEAVALLGSNGAGKSTALRILATVERPSRGKLSLFDLDPNRASTQVRQQLGYVDHRTLLDDTLSARENLRFHGTLFDVEGLESKVEELLTAVGLSDRGDDRVETYSRGMRQRLTLARALVHDPRLLVLDEPFTGLDAQGCRNLGDRLRQAKARGRAVLLTTHQLDEVLPWCDRVVVLRQGSVVEESPASTRDVAGWAHLIATSAEIV